MSDAEAMQEVKALIRFYDRRKANWLLAAEFTLARHNGTLEYIDRLRSRRPWKYGRAASQEGK